MFKIIALIVSGIMILLLSILPLSFGFYYNNKIEKLIIQALKVKNSSLNMSYLEKHQFFLSFYKNSDNPEIQYTVKLERYHIDTICIIIGIILIFIALWLILKCFIKKTNNYNSFLIGTKYIIFGGIYQVFAFIINEILVLFTNQCYTFFLIISLFGLYVLLAGIIINIICVIKGEVYNANI